MHQSSEGILSALRCRPGWLLATACAVAVLGCHSRAVALSASPFAEEPAVAEAVFTHLTADFRKPVARPLGPRRLELDTRRLQWIEGPGGSPNQWIQFDGQHSDATIERVLQHGGAEGRCYSNTIDDVCVSKANAAVVIAMTSPRFARLDSATVRVVMFSELRDAVGEVRWLAVYLLTLQRSPDGWAVISEQTLWDT